MHNQFKTQKFKHLMLAMGPRDLNSAPYSPVHCSSHSMTSFQSSELTELPVVENSQLFAQRAHSARYAPNNKKHLLTRAFEYIAIAATLYDDRQVGPWALLKSCCAAHDRCSATDLGPASAALSASGSDARSLSRRAVCRPDQRGRVQGLGSGEVGPDTAIHLRASREGWGCRRIVWKAVPKHLRLKHRRKATECKHRHTKAPIRLHAPRPLDVQ